MIIANKKMYLTLTSAVAAMKKRSVFISFLIGVSHFLSCSHPVDPPPGGVEYPMASYNTVSSEVHILDTGEDLQFPRSQFFFTKGDSNVLALASDIIVKISSDLSNTEAFYVLPEDLDDYFYPCISPDRNFLAFSSFTIEKWDLYLLDLKMLQLTQLTDTPDTYEWYPGFSADSKKIIFTTERRGSLSNPGFETISIIDLTTLTIDTLITEVNNSTQNARFRFPYFFANDTKALYMSTNLFSTFSDSLITVDLDGTNKQILETQSGRVSGVAVSQNGSRIVYTKNGAPEILASIKNDGTGYHEIVSTYGLDLDDGFSISNGGEKILYWLDNEQMLYTLDGNGTNHQPIARGRNGRYSSDLSLVAFTVIRDK